MDWELLQTPLNLSHYTHAPLTCVVSKPQCEFPLDKPAGFWVSVDGPDDWPAWCQREDYRPEKLKLHYVINLSNDAKILFLNEPFHLDWFTNLYRGEKYLGGFIRWDVVSEKYQGIIIAPYFWQYRLKHIEFAWYYSWDCASGCIWDASAIKSKELQLNH